MSYYDEHVRYYSPLKQNPEYLLQIAELKDISIIDLGCGTGEVSAFLHRRGCNVVGIDSSIKRIEYAREHFPEVEFHHSDFFKFSAGTKFDCALALEVLEHLEPRPSITMKKFKRFLKPSGYLIGSIPVNLPWPTHHHVFNSIEEIKEEVNPEQILSFIHGKNFHLHTLFKTPYNSI